MNLREYERESIRAFVQSAADEGFLRGRVLDFGCGRQPYREIVEAAGGEYHGYDSTLFPASTTLHDHGNASDLLSGSGAAYDAVLCTQVVQYLRYPNDELRRFHGLLAATHGYLVLSWPTNWPEVEEEDLHRFTRAGMRRLLDDAGYEILSIERRGSVWDPRFDVGSNKRVTATGEEFVLGYGVVARA